MFEILKIITIVLFLLNIFDKSFQNKHHRRVYFGSPHIEFQIPYSSVVTIRDRHGAIACSGLLLNSTSVLTAGHCLPRNRIAGYTVGYGSTIVAKQKLKRIIRQCWIKRDDMQSYYDAAILNIDKINLSEDNTFMYFGRQHWNLDSLERIVENKTFMCGYGKYEGQYRDQPKMTDTNVLRCVAYRYSGNVKTVNKTAYERGSHWPKPRAGYLYDHDKHYMVSLSRYPEKRNDPYFATACEFDAGSPIFYKQGGHILLQGIHHEGPFRCGETTSHFDYDYAVLMKSVSDFLNRNPNC